MGLVELIILAVGLSMDAFAVSVCKGLSFKKVHAKHAITVGLYFGVFQAGMPLIGYFLGSQFKGKILNFDHWIAFGLLGIMGINMIKESFKKEENEHTCVITLLPVKEMLLLAVATSIDALAIGVTFAFLQVKILPAVILIGGVTFTLSVIGVKLGNVFGTKYKARAEFIGGVILILLGTNILLGQMGR